MSTTLRVRIKAYDHRLADACAREIVLTARRLEGVVRGPIPLPVKREPYRVAGPGLGDSGPAGKVAVYGRILELVDVSEDAAMALANLALPAGVSLAVEAR